MRRVLSPIAARHRGVRESLGAHPVSPLVSQCFRPVCSSACAGCRAPKPHLRSAEGTGDFEAFGLRKDRSPSASLAAATSRIDDSLRGALRKILFFHGFSLSDGQAKNARITKDPALSMVLWVDPGAE